MSLTGESDGAHHPRRVAALEAQLDRLRDEASCCARDRELLARAERLAGIGSFEWDPDTGAMRWSDHLFRLLGLDPARDTPSLDTFRGRVHPDDIESVCAVAARLIKDGAEGEHTARIITPRGEVRILRGYGAARDASSTGGRRLVGVVRDVTGERNAEYALVRTADLLDSIERVGQLGVWEWDTATDEAVWSPGFVDILGYPEDAPATAQGFWDTVHPEDVQRLRDAMERGIAGEGLIDPVEYRIVTPGGQIKEVVGNLRAFRSHDQGALKLTGVVVDLSGVKRLETELHRAQKMEALGRLAGGVAHEFNNLLMVIMGNAQLLALTSPSDEIEDILAATRDAASLTTQLLAFSHNVPSEPRPVDLNEVCVNATKVLAKVLGEDIQLEVQLADELPAVLGDVTRLNQVLMNLAVNARDAMPDGGPLRITTEVHTLNADNPHGLPAGRYAVLAVADVGVGMDAHTRAHAFEPFFTTKGPGLGTGLGLSTVFGIARHFGGTVSLCSAPGRGTTVRLFLRTAQTTAEARHDVAEDTAWRAEGERLLVVEDAPHVRRVLVRVLTDAGYRVVAAEGPDAALAAWRRAQGDFDALVTDVVMPGMKGTELAQRLRELKPSLRVLFVTGYAPAGAQVDGPVLLKPIAPATLLKTVREVLASDPTHQAEKSRHQER